MDRYDIAIIGTGPAGISAAITARVRNKNIILIGSRELSTKIEKASLINNYPGTGTSTIFRSMLITPPYAFPAVYSDGTVATYAPERDANIRNPYNLLLNSGYAKE
mgnify:FL=1